MRTVGMGTPMRGSGTASDRWTGPVKDKDLTAPPGSPAPGDRYIVAAGGSGDWSGQDDNIAEWTGSVWQFTVPAIGLTTYVEDETEYYSWNGSNWVQESFGPHAGTHQDGGTDEISVAALSGLLADPQTPLEHKNSHKTGGGDAFASTDFLEAVVKRLREAGGPTDLTIGTVGANQYFKRSGDSIVIGDSTPVTSSGVIGSNALVKGDGGVRGVEPTGMSVDASDNITGAGTVNGVDVASHAARHVDGGGDALKLDDLATPDDNTDLDASTSLHGLLKKLGGGTVNFLRADGTWALPKCDIHVSIQNDGFDYKEHTSATFTSVAKFVFPGTTAAGTPLSAKFLIWNGEAGGSHYARIQDVTNGQTIGTVGPFSGETAVIQTQGTLANLPAGEAVFEIQTRDANTKKVRCSGASLL